MPTGSCLDGAAVVLGMWQSGCKVCVWSRIPQEHWNGSPVQVSGVLRPSKKAIKFFSLGGSCQSLCRAKWLSPDAQGAELETWQLTNLSQDPQTAGVHSGAFSVHHTEVTPADQASRGLHMHVHQFEEWKCGEDGSPSSPAAPRSQLYAICEIDALQGTDVSSVVSIDARAANGCESTMHSRNGIQLVDMEEHHMSFNHGGDGSSSYTSSCTDGQMSGNTGRMDGTLSHVDKQAVGFGHVNESEGASKPGMENKESTNSLRKIAALRLPTCRSPAYLQNSQRDSMCYLESLGVNCAKIFEDDPAVKACTFKQIKTLVSALECYGIECNDAGRVFNLCPRVLLLDPEKDLKVATSFLFNEAGLLPKDFCKVIRRCPRLLVMDLDTHLWPTLRFLRSLGFAKMGHAIANNPALLSYDVETKILPRLRLLESWGFTYREAAAMVVRFPAIFNYSAVENLQFKYDYLVNEIKAGKKDLLSFPQYFGYSLESRIRPRHQRLTKLNVSLSIQAMLTLSDSGFNAKFPNVDKAWSMRREDEVGVSLYESIEAKLQELNRESPKSRRLENSDTQVLVTV